MFPTLSACWGPACSAVVPHNVDMEGARHHLGCESWVDVHEEQLTQHWIVPNFTQHLHCELCPSFFTSIVGCLVAAATSCGGEDPGAVGARVAALGGKRFFTLKHLFAIEDMFMWNTSPVWDCMWSSRSSLDWKTVLASAQSATFGQVKRVFCGIIEEAVHTWQERRPCFAAMWLNSWYLERFLFWYLKYNPHSN